MKLFNRGSSEERFWRWFVENSERLFDFESDREHIFGELQTALGRVERGLTFEFGPAHEGRREFIISADGIRDRFPAVQRLAAAAPEMPQWVVIPFRPAKNLPATIRIGQYSLGPDDFWLAAERDGERIGLTIFINGLTEENREPLGGAAFIMLDSALGEYAVETQVGYLDLQPLPEDPAAAGLKPFQTIREVFDTTRH